MYKLVTKFSNATYQWAYGKWSPPTLATDQVRLDGHAWQYYWLQDYGKNLGWASSRIDLSLIAKSGFNYKAVISGLGEGNTVTMLTSGKLRIDITRISGEILETWYWSDVQIGVFGMTWRESLVTSPIFFLYRLYYYDTDADTIYAVMIDLSEVSLAWCRTSYGSIPDVSSTVGLIDTLSFSNDDDDESSGDGGSGTDDGDDVVTPPSLPDIQAIDTGFCTLYKSGLGSIQALASYMFTDDFLESIKKMRADPIDYILGMTVMPVNAGGSISPVTVGNVSTTVSMYKVSSQYVVVDCGTLAINGRTGTYLDYQPYTRYSLFLPFVGDKEIDADEIVGNTLHIYYHVDVLTGNCTCYVCKLVDGADSLLYTFNGNCAIQVPITSANFGQMYLSYITAGTSAVGMIATGAAGGVAAIAGSVAMAGSVAGNVAAAKPLVTHSGGMSGNILCFLKPYLIKKSPRRCVPDYQNDLMGYPCYKYLALGSCTGYTQVDTIQLKGVICTQTELDEIERLLREGVIL